MRLSDYGTMVAFADYMMQGGHRQLLAGAMYGAELAKYYDDDEPTTLYFGAFVRWGDAVMPMMKIEMKQLSIALSYDVNISKLQVASNWRGGFELTGAFRGFLNTRSSTLDKVRCVRF